MKNLSIYLQQGRNTSARFTYRALALYVIVLSYSLAGCQPASRQEQALAEAKRAIAASNAVYYDSFKNNDASIFTERYAEDCCILAPGLPAQCGKGAAKKFFRTAYDQIGIRGGRFVTTAVYGDAENFVTEEGLWEIRDQAGRLFDDGKFLVLWKKTPEGWKMFRDAFSSNRKP